MNITRMIDMFFQNVTVTWLCIVLSYLLLFMFVDSGGKE